MIMPEYLSLYRRILTAATSIKDRSAATLNDNGAPSVSDPSHEELSNVFLLPLTLPSEPSIFQSLVDQGTKDNIAERLASAFDRAIINLRAETEANFTRAWSQILSTPRYTHLSALETLHSQICASYTSVYLRKVENWRTELQHRVLAHKEGSKWKSEVMSDIRSDVSIRPAFNNVSEYHLVPSQFSEYICLGIPASSGSVFLRRAISIPSR